MNLNGTGISNTGALINSGSTVTYGGAVTLQTASSIGGAGDIIPRLSPAGVRSKSADLEEAGKVALRFSLAQCAKNIACPIYIVAGTKDRLTPHTQAEKLAAAVSGPCVLSVIEGGNHVVNNLWYRYRDQTADWMAAQLGAAKR